MKRIFTLGILLAVCALGVFAEDYNAVRIEENMILPDGNIGKILFFKEWNDAKKYANDKSQWDGYSVWPGALPAKTEQDYGFCTKWHQADENEDIQKISAIMNEMGAVYGITFIHNEKQIRRGTLTNKGKKIRYAFMDFFDESHPAYIASKEKREDTMKTIDEIGDSIGNAIVPKIGGPSNNELTFEQRLYMLRHQNCPLSATGNSRGGRGNGRRGGAYEPPLIEEVRHIYYDDGREVYGYVVDFNGNIRDAYSGAVYQYYSVPQEIRDLALKSLE